MYADGNCPILSIYPMVNCIATHHILKLFFELSVWHVLCWKYWQGKMGMATGNQKKTLLPAGWIALALLAVSPAPSPALVTGSYMLTEN